MTSYYCYLQIKSFYYYNKFLTGYWWTQFHHLPQDPLGVSILILWLEFVSSISLTAFFIFFFADLPFVTSLVPEGIILAPGSLQSIDFLWSSMCFAAHPGCGLTFMLWSFEIPLSAKLFIVESPMRKTFFLSLVTFSPCLELLYP